MGMGRRYGDKGKQGTGSDNLKNISNMIIKDVKWILT